MNEELKKLRRKIKFRATSEGVDYEELLLAIIFKLTNEAYDIAMKAVEENSKF